MIAPLSLEVLAQAVADEEAWLANKPERCEVCGHRDCFHEDDRDYGLFCMVDGCRCQNGRIVPPQPVLPGDARLVTITGLGEPLPNPPGVSLEIVFGNGDEK
jgi:hypothetical protein